MNIGEATDRLREMAKKCIEKMFDSAVENDAQAKTENMNDYIALSYAITAMEKSDGSGGGDS